MKRNYKLFKQMLNSEKTNRENLFFDVLIKVIGDYYFLDYGYVNVASRKREVVFARQVAMHLLMKNTKWTLGKIGEKFNRDHATVLHSNQVVLDLKSVNKKIKQEVSKIEQITNNELKNFLKKDQLDSSFHYIDMDNYISVRVADKKGIIFSGYFETEIVEILSKLGINNVTTFNHKKTGGYILEKLSNDNNTRDTASLDS